MIIVIIETSRDTARVLEVGRRRLPRRAANHIRKSYLINMVYKKKTKKKTVNKLSVVVCLVSFEGVLEVGRVADLDGPRAVEHD